MSTSFRCHGSKGLWVAARLPLVAGFLCIAACRQKRKEKLALYEHAKVNRRNTTRNSSVRWDNSCSNSIFHFWGKGCIYDIAFCKLARWRAVHHQSFCFAFYPHTKSTGRGRLSYIHIVICLWSLCLDLWFGCHVSVLGMARRYYWHISWRYWRSSDWYVGFNI